MPGSIVDGALNPVYSNYLKFENPAQRGKQHPARGIGRPKSDGSLPAGRYGRHFPGALLRA
jgi:hypothetical protein